MSTKISDIIVPEVFQPYVIERTAELSALVQSGIVVPDPALDILALAGGKLINMPFFQDLTGDDEVLSDSSSLTPGAIGTGKDVAVLHLRGKAWGVNDLAKALSGDDPMGAIANLVAVYWNRKEQALLISSLKGVFADNAANDSDDLISDVSIADGANAAEGNLIGGSNVIDAATKLGDAASKLTAMCMHSVPFSRLQKLQLIEWIDVSSARAEDGAAATDKVPYFLGKRVLVDDGCPVVAGGTSGFVYTTYLFGQGAIGRGDGAAPVPVETDRDSLAGEDYLIHRRHYLLHPRGIKFVAASVAGEAPSNSECENAANWDRVYTQKNIRMVEMKTNG
jgi:hypothetical protein